MSSSSVIRWSFMVGVAASAWGCVKTGPTGPQSQHTWMALPIVTAVSGGVARQNKGGVLFEVIPPDFKVDQRNNTTCDQERSLVSYGGADAYRTRTFPEYVVRPNHVEFTLKVSNHTGRDLKLAGARFAFSVDEEEATLDGAQFQALEVTLLAPDESKEFTLVGPDWVKLPKQAQLVLTAFEVPTELDDAGHATKRESFAWKYAYKLTTFEKVDQITREPATMTAGEAHPRCGLAIGDGLTGLRKTSALSE
jgi:hypothetical protein